MKQIASLALALALAATPIEAQDTDKDGREELREGVDLLEKGTRLLLKGLLEEFGKVILEIEDQLIDLSGYYPPEILPNGDIIIRRKVPLVPEMPQPGESDI